MSYRPFHCEGHLYFTTASISGWECIFHNFKYINIILDSLSFLRKENRHYLYSFVVMPDHVHFIHKPRGEFTISEVVQNFASFTSHAILKQLRKEKQTRLIDFFHQEALRLQAGTLGGGDKEVYTSGLSMRPRVRERIQHKIWRDFQVKNIFSLEVLEQKMEYLHTNPCNKKWHLVENRADYKYSSACFYDKGIQPIIPIDDIRLLFD